VRSQQSLSYSMNFLFYRRQRLIAVIVIIRHVSIIFPFMSTSPKWFLPISYCNQNFAYIPQAISSSNHISHRNRRLVTTANYEHNSSNSWRKFCEVNSSPRWNSISVSGRQLSARFSRRRSVALGFHISEHIRWNPASRKSTKYLVAN
jgi:hypothetical protein